MAWLVAILLGAVVVADAIFGFMPERTAQGILGFSVVILGTWTMALKSAVVQRYARLVRNADWLQNRLSVLGP